MKCFLTGATGFIGKRLCRELLERGHEVVALHRSGADLGGVETHPGLRLLPGRIEEPSWLPRAGGPFDVLFHSGLNWDALDPAEDEAIIDAFAEKGLGRLIYFSSVLAAGPDLSPQPLREGNEPQFLARDVYGPYKWRLEQFVARRAREGAFDAFVVRPTIVYGPGDRSNVFPLFDFIRKRQLPLWSEGENRIRFCYMENLIKAVMAMTDATHEGSDTYHVGDLECPTLREMCEEVAHAVGQRLRYRNYARRTGRAAGFLRFVANRLGLTNSSATHFAFDKWARPLEADISRLQADFPALDFTPLAAGLGTTAKSYFDEGVL